MSKFFGPGSFISAGDSFFFGAGTQGPPPFSPNIVVPSNNALTNITSQGVAGNAKRRRYVGYYADDLTFFTTNSPTETNFGRPEIDDNSADNYSVMWTGYIYAPSWGDYVLETTSDDASMLWVGDKAITGWNTGNADVNNGGLHGATPRDTMPNVLRMENGWYPFRAVFGESTGAEKMAIRMYKYGSSTDEYISYGYSTATLEGFNP